MSSVFLTDINRDTSGLYNAVLLDENDATVAPAQLSSLTLTLTDRATGAVINSRAGVSVLNANGGTLDISGNFYMQFTALDNQIVSTSSPQVEVHVALFQWTFGSGLKGSHMIQLNILNTSNEEAA